MADPAPRHAHVVYVGLQERCKAVYIFVDRVSPHLNYRYTYDKYTPLWNSGQVEAQFSRQSDHFQVKALGWFSDPQLFGPICQGIPFPTNPPNQSAAFDAWENALVNHLNTNHAGNWTENL